MTNVTKLKIGGTEYNIDYSSLANLPNLPNYLPDGTTITVGASGADYTDIQTAINSLTGKISDGTVKISILAGTYTVSSTSGAAIKVDTTKFNFGKLVIQGAGVDDTIISTSNVADWQAVMLVTGKSTIVEVSKIAFIHTNSSSNNVLGLSFDEANGYFNSCKFTNFKFAGVYIASGSNVKFGDYISIINCAVGIQNRGSILYSNYGPTLTMQTVTTGLMVEYGGIIQLITVSKSFTSVTNATSQNIGTVSANGLIMGSLA